MFVQILIERKLTTRDKLSILVPDISNIPILSLDAMPMTDVMNAIPRNEQVFGLLF
jgi:hypothetical protein